MQTDFHTSYKNSYSGMKQQVLERELRKKKEHQLKDFNFLSANVLNFLPEVPIAKHDDIYLEILTNNALLSTEVNYPGLIDELEIEGDASVVEASKKRATIYCTYHLGSYRSIIGYLAKAAVDFVLIVDTNTFNKQLQRIQNTVHSIWNHYGKAARFELVDAERVDIGIVLSKYLMQGVSVVIYLDGNTGVGGIFNKNDQMLHIDFLAGQIFSRKGVSTLSYATKSPIVPVISYYVQREGAPTLKFYDVIKPEDGPKDKNAYALEITRKLYGILAENLKSYYSQWEGWLYLHKYLDFEKLSEQASASAVGQSAVTVNRPIYFNDVDFGFFKMDAACYLFNKRTYQSFKINDTILTYLHQLKTQDVQHPIAEPIINDTIIGQLASKGILLAERPINKN